MYIALIADVMVTESCSWITFLHLHLSGWENRPVGIGYSPNYNKVHKQQVLPVITSFWFELRNILDCRHVGFKPSICEMLWNSLASP